MSRIFVTGSSEGLGLAAALELLANGHDVVLHARSQERAHDLRNRHPGISNVVIGDLASAAQTRGIAQEVNAMGRMDAVIHNAGIFMEPERGATDEGHPKVLMVNTLAPYVLTALIERPSRLVYLSSGMHRDGQGSLRDIDWVDRRWQAGKAYSETKLHVAALSAAVARRWPHVLSNAVDPGWVPTRMGGAGAPDDLELGHRTQTWLAVSEEPAAKVSGKYWYHKRQQEPAREVTNEAFQDQLLARLSELTGISI